MNIIKQITQPTKKQKNFKVFSTNTETFPARRLRVSCAKSKRWVYVHNLHIFTRFFIKKSLKNNNFHLKKLKSAIESKCPQITHRDLMALIEDPIRMVKSI